MDPEPNQGAKADAAPELVDASASSRADDSVTTTSGAERRGADSGRKRRGKAAAVQTSGSVPNNVRRLRQNAMMSKAELARRAGVSPLTIDRVESGCPCRMDTKRKILEALGLQPSAAKEVFPDEDLG
jgi:ribosome-binding protein aMBF1 (putative translation factor)